jgi:YD repeat-containing protein
MGYSSTISHDADSRVTSQTDADGRQRNFSYDNAGELTSETWLNSSNQVIYTATYSYDAAGELTSEADGSSSYSVIGRFKTSHLWALQNQPRDKCLVRAILWSPFPQGRDVLVATGRVSFSFLPGQGQVPVTAGQTVPRF